MAPQRRSRGTVPIVAHIRRHARLPSAHAAGTLAGVATPETIMQVHGQCHCGAIRFEAQVDPSKVTICHCRDCQVLTGTAYRTTVPAAIDDFVLRAGTPKRYVKVADSGNRRVQAFCGDCGTPIYACAFDAPATYGLRIGALAERAALPPQRRIWCRSALPWSQSLEGLPQRAAE
jgi:hypothetical protein